MLEVKDVSYSYNGKQWALRNISFSIDTAGVVGLLGANGAGKSTLMNLICGILHHQQGEIFINEKSIRKNRIAYLNHIGFLPQQAPLYLDLTIKEYLLHVADFKYIPQKDVKKAVEKVMEKCGLTHFKNRLIKNLSGGYQQRVGIAQAIIHSPQIIILDEPTKGLDPHRIIEIRKLILEIAKNTLVLLSTHIISEIEKISNRILVIEGGNLLIDKSLAEFKNLLPQEQYLITLSEKRYEALQYLKEQGFEVIAVEENQIRLKSKNKATNALKILLGKGFVLEAMYPEHNSIEEIYHFLSNKK